MNKLLAILLLLGAFAGYSLSTDTSYQVQDQTRFGQPVGKPRTVYIGNGDRVFYIAFGAVCLAGSLYFIAKIRRDDAR